MNRSGYSEDLNQWDIIRWRGAVASAIRGLRGQALLMELADALDSMPNKRLADNDLQTLEGEVCALGLLGQVRGLNVENLDQYNHKQMAAAFACAPALIAEIEYVNDDYTFRHQTPEERWATVREWVAEQLSAPRPRPRRHVR